MHIIHTYKFQQTLIHLHFTKLKNTENKIMDILPFIIPKVMQYLEINFTKEIKNFYNEDSKSFKTGI